MTRDTDPDIALDRAALFLDIDGTVLDLAPTPDRVQVPPALVGTISALAAATEGAIAFVTGRSIANVDRLFRPLRLAAIGGHGAEFRARRGEEIERSADMPATIRRWLMSFDGFAPGVVVEDKGSTLAIHFRRAPDAGKRILRALSGQHGALLTADLQILQGKEILEVKPRRFNKGTALRRMMQHAPFAGRVPHFFGDDTTDEDAFRVLPEFGGSGYSVGRDIAGVSRAFETPEDVRLFLSRLAATGKVS